MNINRKSEEVFEYNMIIVGIRKKKIILIPIFYFKRNIRENN